MPYIAGQRLTIAGEYREPGAPVPEADAEHWRTLPDLVATGHLVWVDELPKSEPMPTSEASVEVVAAAPAVDAAPPPKPIPRKSQRSHH